MVTSGQTIIDPDAIVAEAIPVALIDPSPLNRHSTEADVAKLAQTIESGRLLAPIAARPRDGGRYEIIYGERRWRAFRLLARETIPCIVKDLSDEEAHIERVVENFQRQELTFMEQGEAVLSLMELTDRDVSEIANRLGQSVAWVYRRAKLTNLIPAWREELARDDTDYSAIRDSVNKLEEIAILPPATQQTLLRTGALRCVKTTRELRDKIARFFMSLDAKPWTREWEKKTYSGSGKKRCDACLKRTDRENALFADPDNPNAGRKMCLDPECWQSKCLSWCKSRIADNPGMVPVQEDYRSCPPGLAKFFGVKPLAAYVWKKRDDDGKTREGYAAAFGVVVDGANIGRVRQIWMPEPDEDDDGDSDVSAVNVWQRGNTNRYRERQELTVLITADIGEYLADIDTNATIPAVQLDANKLRAAAWFGLPGYAGSDEEEETTMLNTPDWNPLAWAWSQTVGNVARHVAHAAASDITRTHNGDRDNDVDAMNAASLASMFEIPIDMITTRANETLYKATREEQNADSRDDAGDIEEDAADGTDGATAEDSPEPAEPVVPVDVETMLDPEDTITIDGGPYMQKLATAQ